jgi:hypothetical protein
VQCQATGSRPEMSDIYRYISMVINIGRFWAYRCIAITLPSFQKHKNSVAIALTAKNAIALPSVEKLEIVLPLH